MLERRRARKVFGRSSTARRSTAGNGDPRLWRVEDGAIVGETTPEKRTEKNTFLIWRGGRPGDFVLKLQFKLANHNSGVHYRSREEPEKWGRWILGGYQADIAAKTTPYTGIFYEERGRGILAKRGERIVIGEDHKPHVTGKTGEFDELTAAIKPDDWNDYEIVAEGNRLKHIINGRLMADVTDNDAKKRSMSGLLGFQLHAGPPMKVQFRDIRIKTAPPAGKSENSGKAKKKIAFIAGPASHGYGEHEYRGGCLLLAECMGAAYPNVETAVFEGEWPKDRKALDDADAIVIFFRRQQVASDVAASSPSRAADGPWRRAGLYPLRRHRSDEQRRRANETVDRGQLRTALVGQSVLDGRVQAVSRPSRRPGTEAVRYRGRVVFQTCVSLMGWTGVTPILSAIPPDAAREGPDGPSSGNPTVRSQKGKAEHLAWVRQRPGGGLGFGTTGGHWHWNWANDNFRKAVLNGIAWVAKLDIPQDGVPSKTPTLDSLIGVIDEPKPADFDREKIHKLIESWE